MTPQEYRDWYGYDRADKELFEPLKQSIEECPGFYLTVMRNFGTVKENKMKQLWYVIKNYKEAYAALMSMYSLEGVIAGYKTKTKKGPSYLYGKIGQATVEVVDIFTNDTQESV